MRLFIGLLLPALSGAITPTTITLGSTPNPSVYGQPITFTATVVPTSVSAAVTGTVNFYLGSSSRFL